MSFCSECGKPVDPGVHFCPDCGHKPPVTTEEPPQIGSPKTAPITQLPEADVPPEPPSSADEPIGIMGWMRKLGIFRSGTYSGTYTSAKDMPTELLMDDVFDAKKDLIQKGDFKRRSAGSQTASNVTGKSNSRVGRIIYFLVMTLFAGIWLSVCIVSTNSGSAILFQLLLWIGLGVVTGLFTFAGRFSGLIIAGLTLGVFLISFILLVMTVDSTETVADPVLSTFNTAFPAKKGIAESILFG